MENRLEQRENYTLERAREYETIYQAQIPKSDRPMFHLTPPVGWLNDPNGFSCYQGDYHLFFQYYPYNTNWGPMHWGHGRTKDFLHWEMLPCALAPDMEYDKQGCFSGSAVEKDGKHILMYTNVTECETQKGRNQVRQQQSIAIGDGTDYQKLDCNPVITADMLPEGSSHVDFRDPKIWREGDGFRALVASMNEDGSGQLALFSSTDVKNWEFEGIIDTCKNRYGKMWECPDFFSLDGQQVLLVSPQFMRAEGLEFHNGNNAVYFVGSFDRQKKQFLREEGYSVDYGLDFYAPQTVETPDGRRIMIGWMQSWDNYLTPEEQKWSGVMSIPRELRVVNGRLVQNPVRELEGCRTHKVTHSVMHTEAESRRLKLEGISGRVFDMTVTADVQKTQIFSIHLAASEEYDTVLTYDVSRGTLTIDRTNCGLRKDLICVRSMYAEPENGRLKLRVLMDKYSLEIFVNDGKQAASSLIYTPLEAAEIEFESIGKISFEVEKYDLE